MKKQLLPFLLLLLLAVCPPLAAQQSEKYPLNDYEELTDSKPHDDAATWQRAMKTDTQFSWGSTDIRYPKHDVPQLKPSTLFRAKAWKGERVNAQAVLWTRVLQPDVKIVMSDLRCGSHTIPASATRTHFVRYVMTDELNKDKQGGCGCRDNKADWDSSMVADVLDINLLHTVQPYSVQPIWLNVWVPSDTHAGRYTGTLTVSGKSLEPMRLKVEIEVANRTLPRPQEWHLNLDLWQNPYAVARYYQVPLWSKAHFDALRPIMQMLADAGQYGITASIMHKPWNGQTEDHYDSMVTRIKKLDGTWSYDYAVFDKWVEFMMNDMHIDRLISCYTMIPWNLRFDYYDEATNRIQFVEARPGESAYAEYWTSFLKDFAHHLKAKGWFEKTAISMDERPMEAMQEAIRVIKAADPNFKITLAGNYHDEIQSDLYYLSIPYGHRFPEAVLQQRRANGQISTVYTCCSEAFPNTFTFSAPAEAAWTAIHAVAGGYDGYLRWAVNSWTADPLRDSRFRTWAAGDTYSIYPGPRSSIRFERLVEGLQDAEKITLLREEFVRTGAKSKLNKLNHLVSTFTPEVYDSKKMDASEMVRQLHELLNSF